MRLSKDLVLAVLVFLFTVSIAYGQCQETVSVKYLAPPIYPVIALTAKLQGTVKVEVKLAPNGKVISAKASGAHDILNQTSEANALQWTFSPIVKGCDYTLTYVYKLEGKESYHPRPTRIILELPHIELIAQPVTPNTSD